MHRYGDQAAFVATGGYHHHVGLNTWMSSGAPLAPGRRGGARRVVFATDGEAREATDPDGIRVVLGRREAGGALPPPRDLPGVRDDGRAARGRRLRRAARAGGAARRRPRRGGRDRRWRTRSRRRADAARVEGDGRRLVGQLRVGRPRASSRRSASRRRVSSTACVRCATASRGRGVLPRGRARAALVGRHRVHLSGRCGSSGRGRTVPDGGAVVPIGSCRAGAAAGTATASTRTGDRARRAVPGDPRRGRPARRLLAPGLAVGAERPGLAASRGGRTRTRRRRRGRRPRRR